MTWILALASLDPKLVNYSNSEKAAPLQQLPIVTDIFYIRQISRPRIQQEFFRVDR
jgi:hypothetical protein